MNSDFFNTLLADGLVSDRNATLTPLTGGVSSDIYLVTDGQKKFVVKRALEQLKVEADWYADITRNEVERNYISYVASAHPTAVPQIIAAGDGYFAMEFLGEGFSNWKQELLQGRFTAKWAEKAGSFLGDIHRRSAGSDALAEQFNRMDLFLQLRINPYLLATGLKHPDVQALFNTEAERLQVERLALVHGDFSPKNMLVKDDRLVVLDSEAACFADPAFDTAFLLTHLFLKVLYHRNYFQEIAHLISTFRESYGAMDKAMDLRTSRLLLMLLLARVDGKSPVEYLQDDASRDFIRTYTTTCLRTQMYQFPSLLQQWLAGIQKLSTGTQT